MSTALVTDPLETLRADLLVFLHFEDIPVPRGALALVDWALGGAVSRLSLSGRFVGAAGSTALLNAAGKFPTEQIALVGAGRAAGLSRGALTEAGRTAAGLAAALRCQEVAVALPFHALPGSDPAALVAAFREGFAAAAHPAPATLRFLAPAVSP
ncbi:MAG: hypothetical protein HYY54_06530 [candidate division NC10 bacterium]|nr:hypothetical protein [candidate division NC10 bacterium]